MISFFFRGVGWLFIMIFGAVVVYGVLVRFCGVV